jgi:ribonuclease P protein component
MLSREYRLPARVKLIKARYVKTPLFSVRYVPNSLPQSRFAFLVRKTVDKRSVVRNRIRRVFRSCVEEMREDIASGVDMLFFLEKGIMEIKQKDLCLEIQKVLRQQNILKVGE